MQMRMQISQLCKLGEFKCVEGNLCEKCNTDRSLFNFGMIHNNSMHR